MVLSLKHLLHISTWTLADYYMLATISLPKNLKFRPKLLCLLECLRSKQNLRNAKGDKVAGGNSPLFYS